MAEVFALALLAMSAYPYVVELVHGLLNYYRVIGQYACLKITFILTFHSDTCACQICTAYIDFLAIKDEYLEMNTGAEHALQTVI